MKDLGDFCDLPPKLSLPRQGRRVVDKSSLGRLSGLDGYEHGFQCQFESRRPHFVRRVGTVSLKPVSAYLTFPG